MAELSLIESALPFYGTRLPNHPASGGYSTGSASRWCRHRSRVRGKSRRASGGRSGNLGYELFKPSWGRLLPITDPPRSEDPENVFCIHPDRPLPRIDGAVKVELSIPGSGINQG